MKRSMWVLAVSALALAGCGQKGALYLPKKGTVVTRPAGAQPEAAPQPGTDGTPAKPDDKKDEDQSKPQS